MDYETLARDVHAYMEDVGIAAQADTHGAVRANQQHRVLVGHSLGAKTAMTMACMFPDSINGLVSLDASPVDRTPYPHLNETSERMIEEAMSLGSLEGLPLEDAIKKIKREV